MFKCKKCTSEKEYKVFAPFVNTRRQWVSDSKWSFHVKSICADCHAFNGFLPQTEDLMNEVRGSVFVPLDLSPRN